MTQQDQPPPEGLNPFRWALYYATAYNYEVIPCNWRPGDWAKAPCVPKREGGQGVKDATTDPDIITGWWRRWPKALIGGRVPWGQFVIDIDPREKASLRALCTLCDELTDLPIPRTRSVESGRLDGGIHLFFNRPVDPNTGELLPLTETKLQKKLGPGYDLKTNLGYTILPPSLHPDTGAPYDWRDNGLASPVLDLPDKLLQLLLRPVHQYKGGTGRPNSRSLEGILRRVAEETATRNKVLFWGACRLVEDHYPEPAFQALHAAASSTGLADWEIVKTITSAQQSLGGIQ